jgi:hypothetical protein
LKTPISHTAFPATKYVAEPQVEGICCKDILRDTTLLILVVWDIFAQDKQFNMCTINNIQTSFEEWKKVGVTMNAGWYLVHTRKFNILVIESLQNDHVEYGLENPVLCSVFPSRK